jgi:hypothetical protein
VRRTGRARECDRGESNQKKNGSEGIALVPLEGGRLPGYGIVIPYLGIEYKYTIYIYIYIYVYI